MLNPIAALLIEILEIYKWVVIAAVIVSWLTAFNVINVHNNFVRTLLRILLALTEPVFRQVRRVLPRSVGWTCRQSWCSSSSGSCNTRSSGRRSATDCKR